MATGRWRRRTRSTISAHDFAAQHEVHETLPAGAHRSRRAIDPPCTRRPCAAGARLASARPSRSTAPSYLSMRAPPAPRGRVDGRPATALDRLPTNRDRLGQRARRPRSRSRTGALSRSTWVDRQPSTPACRRKRVSRARSLGDSPSCSTYDDPLVTSPPLECRVCGMGMPRGGGRARPANQSARPRPPRPKPPRGRGAS